jgi:ParB-like chromosome segregation protein Spo0J
VQVKTVKISELKPHPKNPRIHPDSAIEKLERSIKEFGWTNPILVSADGYVLAGHARLKAAEKAGISEVPVIYLSLEGVKAEAYMIADNRLQEDTLWDDEVLAELLADISKNDIDMLLTGFEAKEFEKLLNDEIPREDLSVTLNDSYELIVECENESELEALYDKMTGEGYQCRVSIF